jgi:erythromycin esterase-like protein
MAATETLRPLTGEAADYDALLERFAGKRFALLGEASHGTHDFYRERAELTKRLIAEHGVTAVVAEADWADAYRVNLFVRALRDDRDPDEALSDSASPRGCGGTRTWSTS